MRGMIVFAAVVSVAACGPAPGVPGVPGSRAASNVLLAGTFSAVGGMASTAASAVQAGGQAAASLVTYGAGTLAGAVVSPSVAGGAAAAGTPPPAGAAPSAPGSVPATQVALQPRAPIEQAARSADALARDLLETPRQEIDACAIRIFRTLLSDFGYAVGSRYALRLGASVQGLPDSAMFGGLISVSREIAGALSTASDQMRRTVTELLEIENDANLQAAVGAVAEMRDLCPASLVSRIAGLLSEGQT